MIKFTRREITEYALYKYIKNNITDFDIIFNANKIITEIVFRYDLEGRFNHNVLKLMPMIGLSWVTSEEQLQEIVDRLTDDMIESEFVEITTTFNGYYQTFYVKSVEE